MNLHELIVELRQRNVLKVASVYAVSAAGVVQVLTATAPFLGIPDSLVTVFIILAIIGFPMAVFISWKYEMIEEKDVIRAPNQNGHTSHSFLPTINLKTSALLILALIGVLALIYTSAHWLTGVINPLSRIEKERIAVLEFQNHTGDPSLDHLGSMAAHLISQSLADLDHVELSASTLPAASRQLEVLMGKFGFSNNFKRESGIDNLIIGRYYLHGDSLEFHSEIVEADNGRLVTSVEDQWAPRERPHDALISIGQHILGFWLSRDHPLFAKKHPRADALKEYLMAVAFWEKDNDKMIEHLNKCIQLDSTFTRAHLLLLSMYDQLKWYDKQDSLYRLIEDKELLMDPAERNLFYYFQASSHGNNKKAYEYFMNEYRLAPHDLFVNSRALILSMNLINDPVRAIEIGQEIRQSEIDYFECFYCLDRANAYVTALMDLKKYRLAYEHLLRIESDTIDMTLKVLEIRALAALGDIPGLMEILDKAKSQRFSYTDDTRYLRYETGLNLLLAGNRENVDVFLSPIINSYEEELALYPPGIDKWKTHSRLGRIYLIQGDYANAATHLKIHLDHLWEAWYPYKEYFMALYGHAAARAGDHEAGHSIINELESNKTPQDRGQISYYQAQIFAGLGMKEKAMESLKHAVMEGKQFYHFDFQYDPLFSEFKNEPKFQEILRMNRT